VSLMKLWSPLAIGVSICLAGGAHASEGSEALSPANADQLLIVRAGVRTVVSIQSAYQGDLDKFVFIIPTPVPVKSEDLHRALRLFDKLDRETSPYLVATPHKRECVSDIVFDGDMGIVSMYSKEMERSCGGGGRTEYSVVSADTSGDISQDYDVNIWPAKQTEMLLPWLRHHRFPASTPMRAAIEANILRGMSFIVATVNMQQAKKEGWSRPPPLQFAFDSEAFSLPFNLAALDSRRQLQDTLVYFLTLQGKVESKNYPTFAVAKGREVVTGVQGRFGEFYDCMMDGGARSSHGTEAAVEYFATPEFLRTSETQQAGAQWLPADALESAPAGRALPQTNYHDERQPFFMTRLRIRYSSQYAPTDMNFAELSGKTELGRMVLYDLQKPLATLEGCEKPIAELDCNSTCDAIMSNAQDKIYPKFPRSHEACVAACLDEKERAMRRTAATAASESADFEAAQATTRTMCPAWNAGGENRQEH